MSRADLAKSRRKFIKKRRQILSRKVDTLQNQLLEIILDQFWSQFETSDGKLISNGRNITIASTLDKIYDTFNRVKHLPVVISFERDLLEVNSLNSRYFKTFGYSDTLFESVRERVLRSTRKSLGIEPTGSLSKNGFLETFVNDINLRDQIKKSAYSAVSSGQSHQAFRKVLSDVIVGSPDYKGGLQAHYRTFAYDLYQETDRSNQAFFASDLGLEAFIYAGTVVKNTRKFCKERVGKVFTIQEAEKWQNKRWQGKNRDYNPLTDMGGYNCLHQADFISNEEAARRRPDLEVDDRGVLVKA